MANIYRLLLLLLPFTLTAQLTVKPSENGDPTFIYVKNYLLFVEQEVELYNNNSTEIPSSIYLREGAQLLQGKNQVNDNAGDGLLSLYQDTRSDSYDYNYWGSPVRGIFNTNFTHLANMVDPTDTLTARNVMYENVGWYNGQGRSGLDYAVDVQLKISPRWLYLWNVNSQFWQHIGATGGVPPGYGFTMKGTNETTVADGTTPYVDANNQYYELRGIPNSGNISIDVQTDEVGVNPETYTNATLAGNPYPSALDLAAFFLDPDNQEIDKIMYWDEDRTVNSHYYIHNKGGYGTWIPGSNDLESVSPTGDYTVATFYNWTNGGTQGSSTGTYGENLPRRYAPIGQGFMLTTPNTNEGIQTVTFKNSHRVYKKEHPDSSFFRTPVEESKVRFHIIFNRYSHFRDMLLKFSDNATRGFDRGMDARHPMDAVNQDAYFVIGDDLEEKMPLVIQSRPFNPEDAIPINFKIQVQGSVRIRAVEELNVPYEKIFLYDRETRRRYEIKGNSVSVDVATAQLTLPAGDYTDRFYIVFEMPEEEDPGHPDERRSSNSNLDIAQDNIRKVMRVRNTGLENINEINLYDTAGRLVYFTYNAGEQLDYEIPTHNLSTGIYTAVLITDQTNKVIKKIRVLN